MRYLQVMKAIRGVRSFFFKKVWK